MISSRNMMDSSHVESVFTRQHYLTIVVAPVPDSHSHGAWFAFTQPRNKFGEGMSCLVSANVLTSDAVENHDDGRFFQSHLFFLNPRRGDNHE